MQVLTRSYDNARTGANTSETVLTPAAVGSRGVEILRTLHTPDDPRLDAQPLYLPGVVIGGQAHNVVYQATNGNTVYAFDADTGTQLWKTNLGTAVNSVTAIDSHTTNVKIGIMSTPVIDPTAGVLYACAWVSTNNTGNWQTAQHFLAALDVTTGALRHPLLNLEGTTYNPGHGLGVQRFRSAERKQRSALAMVNGAVIIAFGSVMEVSGTAQGWLIAVETASWSVAAAWTSSQSGHGAGIWMSGSAPAIQSDGSIWVVTGNGEFDGVVDFAESVVRLSYTPAAGTTPASLAVTGWWTPWTDDGRTGGNAEGEADEIADAPRASNFRLVPHLARLGVAPEDMGDGWGDQDLAASGIVLVESQGIALVGSKDGILYTVKLSQPGNTTPTNLAIANAPANYAKLAAPPILYTYFAPSVNPATPNPATLNVLPANVTHHLHGTPVLWSSANHGLMHFCGGENGNVRAWSLAANNSSNYLGCSSAYASPEAPVPPGGMPGWGLALSANGNTGGVLWAMMPYKDANLSATNGRLLAFDAANLAEFGDGSGEIVPLWDSQDWNWNYLHPKFNRPVAVDGKVLVPTYDGRVLVLGLA
jgi:hypothetical protein